MENLTQIRQQLSQEYKYRTELHVHTLPVSGCSEVYPEEMVKIYAEKGYDAAVLTNHFTIDCGVTKNDKLKAYIENYEEAKRAGEKYNLKVFLGAEIRFTENHNDYLIYGVDEEILSVCYDWLDRGVEAFRKQVSLNDSVFLQAHPFRDGIVLCPPQLLDGIETMNMHQGHNSRIGIATRYAHENNIKIKTIGTDFHHKNLGHEAVSALRTRVMPKDTFDIAKILRSGDYLFEIGENALMFP